MCFYSHRMLPVDTLQVTVDCPSRAHWSDSRSRQLGEYMLYVLAPGDYPIQLGTFTGSGEAILQQPTLYLQKLHLLG